jgi:hypothetical protein
LYIIGVMDWHGLKTLTRKQLIKYSVSVSAILLATAFIEYAMGRIPICKCGYTTLWAGNANSFENSQMLSDWYTFSHIIHGFIFYWLLGKFAKRLPPPVRFIIALIIEAAWEILENSPIIINRYRTATMSLDYYGDSIINSLSDILAMVLGFILASKLPVKVSIASVVLMEITVGYVIRDNLTLNIIMLLYPFQAILDWQMGPMS